MMQISAKNADRLKICCCVLLCGVLGFFSPLKAQEEWPPLIDYAIDNPSYLKKFTFSDSSAWRLTQDENRMVLDLFAASNYSPPFRSPVNLAILNDVVVGSFIMEIEAKQTGREYGHRDLCFFFGMKDASNFYYVHIASEGDQNAHNVFLVNDEDRRSVGDMRTSGVQWGKEWHKIRIARDVEEGSIKVFFDDMSKPIMETRDQHFSYGYIGFGSFDDTGRFANLKVWGEVVIPGSSLFKN